jgi:hypothetical protein
MFVDAEASVLCNTQKSESTSEVINNCQMYVEHFVQPGQVTLITLTSDASVDLVVNAEISVD